MNFEATPQKSEAKVIREYCDILRGLLETPHSLHGETPKSASGLTPKDSIDLITSAAGFIELFLKDKRINLTTREHDTINTMRRTILDGYTISVVVDRSSRMVLMPKPIDLKYVETAEETLRKIVDKLEEIIREKDKEDWPESRTAQESSVVKKYLLHIEKTLQPPYVWDLPFGRVAKSDPNYQFYMCRNSVLMVPLGYLELLLGQSDLSLPNAARIKLRVAHNNIKMIIGAPDQAAALRTKKEMDVIKRNFAEATSILKEELGRLRLQAQRHNGA